METRRVRCARGRRLLHAVCALGVVFASGGCEREDWKPDVLVSRSIAEDEAMLQLGHDGYRTYCVGCHGEQGDGRGPAARFLHPRPRDFTLGIIKFAAVESGQLPHDADLKRVIRNGLHGTSMSPWRFMAERQLDAIVQYVKTFATDAYADDEPHVEIVASLDPWEGDPEAAVAEGENVYHLLARCNSCHPTYLTRAELYAKTKADWGVGQSDARDNQYQSLPTESDWGDEIIPPDFLTAQLRTGTDEQSLYRVIASGVGGTAMPTWKGALPEDKLWALVHYVKSLSDLRGTPEAAAIRRRLLAPPPFTPPQARGSGTPADDKEES